MKKLFSMFMLALVSLTTVAQVQTIALLEPRAGEGSVSLTPMEKAMVRGELRKAIVNMPGYQAITRADIDQMMKEQNFQRTGMVSDEQIKQMGEMSGADYICVSTLTKSNTEFYIEAYLIHLESGRMSNPASQYGELTNGKFANMLPVCETLAKELLGGTSTQTKQATTPTVQTAETPQTQQGQTQEEIKTEYESSKKSLWTDKYYSAECRKEGKKVFEQKFRQLYVEIYNKKKNSGATAGQAKQEAYVESFTAATEEGNKAVLQCHNGK